MNMFNRKSLTIALATLGGMGGAGVADAVYVNPDGLGQVLIYPYYTVREKAGSPYNSLLSVVNSTASAKAVKVRFLEGRNSREVLDFNLFLSAKDVWTAGVIPTAGGAGIFTFDKSCTVPSISSSPTTPNEFVNFLFDDGAGDSLDRTREGYVEIIEMGAIAGGSKTEAGVTHAAGGGAPTCKDIDDTSAIANTRNPTGGLFGSMTLVNVLAGTDFSVDPVALDAFRTIGRYDLPGDVSPQLTNAQPATAIVFTNGASVTTTMDSGIDAVSAVLMHDHVYNEFVLDTGTNSETDWIVTMPTKRFYYNSDGTVNNLFQHNFTEDGACDDITTGLFDREEFKTAPGFSPSPVGKPSSLCWEANVITFNAKVTSPEPISNVFASKNTRNIVTTFQNGWLDLQFFPLPSASTADGADPHFLVGIPSPDLGNLRGFFGLPTVGFAAWTFNNGTKTDGAGVQIQSNYGGSYIHKGTKAIVTTQPAP